MSAHGLHAAASGYPRAAPRKPAADLSHIRFGAPCRGYARRIGGQRGWEDQMHFQRDNVRRAAAAAGIAATIGMVPLAVACGEDGDKAPAVSTTPQSGSPSPATSPAVTTMPTGSVETSPVDTGAPPQSGPS